MPARASARRRSRAETESDAEAETARESFPKRARSNTYTDGHSEHFRIGSSAEQNYLSRGHRQDQAEDEDGEDYEDADLNTFQPGAIVRVKLRNFVTYENAEFFPGPSLNMVIGPNGTGKSSLVCAICLGLGWGPGVLGRATDVGSFVKNNTESADIEIELQKRENEANNHVVHLRIIKDGNTREWSLNGKRTSLKNVQHLTKSLSIQIDNLCQFLPQDKVSSFAGLSPVELLQRTQEAAAPEQMLEWHGDLKKLRKEEKEVNAQNSEEQGHLQNLETRQQSLRGEVERQQERQAIGKRVQFLEYTVPLVEYNEVVARYKQYKEEKEHAQARYRELQERIAPTLRLINDKRDYRARVAEVAKERDKTVKSAERDADARVITLENLQAEIESHDEEISSERKARSTLNKEITSIQNNIRTLQARKNETPVAFNPAEWNERAREKEHEIRDLRNKAEDVKARFEEIRNQAVFASRRRDDAAQELAASKSQEGQLLNKLEKVSKETAQAWKWVQEHMGEFSKEVYAPPMISCSIKDPRFASAVESMMSKSDFLAITAQTFEDMKKLSDQIHGVMNLSDITLRTVQDSVPTARPLSPAEMSAYGMDGWAIDFLDGPNAVLAMLCGSKHLEKCAITRQDVNESQYDMIIREGRLRSWVTNSHTYNVSARAEYGPSARTTNTKKIRPASVWIDQPIDTSAQDEIILTIEAAKEEVQQLKQQADSVTKEGLAFREHITVAAKELEKIKSQKAELQKADSEYRSLPMMIERVVESLATKKAALDGALAKEKKARDKLDMTVLRKVKEALKYKEHVSIIRMYHEELLDARIRLLEAESDVVGLEERNHDIVRQQNEEQERVRTIEAQSQQVKSEAKIKKKRCTDLFSTPEIGEDLQQELSAYATQTTLEALNIEIAAEQSKLDYIHASNPNAIRDFESRQVEIDRLKAKIIDSTKRLERISYKITKTREKWEPLLDKLVGEISDAFSYNFEQIGCAGEVSVHKDEDFDLWSIQIKVKFRENETLQLLDQHRQSGGERSVSTIFYLMSLQALAQAPFRVVDEINQGMDPRNERMVHERMVDIACKEHTSQYFLITPKLLTGLRYHPRMKVLCIASGEHMPEDYRQLDINKILGIRRAIMAAG